MAIADVIGLTAGFCTTVSFLPQIVRMVRTKSGEDVSAVMLLVLLTGTGLWLAFGIMTLNIPIIAANGVTFVLVTILLLCKARYRQSDKARRFLRSRP